MHFLKFVDSHFFFTQSKGSSTVWQDIRTKFPPIFFGIVRDMSSILDILFCQITTFIKVHVAFVFWLQTLLSLDFTKIFQLKGLKPKKRLYELLWMLWYDKKCISNLVALQIRELLHLISHLFFWYDLYQKRYEN